MSSCTEIDTVGQLLSALGKERVRIRLFGDGPPSSRSGKKRGDKALSQASWSGRFPSSYFRVIEDLCKDEGIECPRGLFAFKSAEDAA